ncbi:MAG: valine--tRNA ligase [candidate division Zixibacteria bacterium]|nr:valine--tRNA ligase [candidate division Zixibacteria bacterium]
MTDIPKQYSPHEKESAWYEHWLEKGIFTADSKDNGKDSYSIVIPPPNVTDVLHLGHALNNTLQDIMIRWKRMDGFESEWLPGVDHAGIATQVKVEKELIKEDTSRQQIGREKFLERVWAWKEDKFENILNQLQQIGCSCDWSRTRFTMDEGLSEAVKEVFIRLYNEKLIYKGEYITNWCPRCQTSLSDDEVEHQDFSGHLWYVKYKIKGSDNYLTIATTRPETMLGDTALAVNPSDKRYQKWVGKTAILPILERELPIIADDYIDPEFGTGVLKVTPAHDPNDFEIGQRHDLQKLNIFTPDAHLNENTGKFKSLDRNKARKAVVKELDKKGHLAKTENYTVSAGTCYRCHTVIEPYLTEQWYVKMKPLAKPAIDAVKTGKLHFHPEYWSKTYLHWLENIRDWCISRQLWWGHRIPIYYCDDCGHVWVAREDPEKCPECDSGDVRQDEDVLDTWFSSWLWPFSTFGWPDETPDLKRFYPTDSLFTASEIIFLWVARMVMAGNKFMDELPFSDVYIHGTVRDGQGRKMSKSLGNGIDPRDVIREFGADSLRISLLLATPEGQDPNITMNTFELGRNFGNKIWNASRFVKMNLGEDFPREYIDGIQYSDEKLDLMDKWILSRLNATIRDVRKNLRNFKLSTAAKNLYDFIWRDYCDWYVELAKPRLYEEDNEEDGKVVRNVLAYVIDNMLRLLSPYMPFITEEIWHLMRDLYMGSGETITLQKYPELNEDLINSELEKKMEAIQTVVGTIRSTRSEMNVPPSKKADIFIKIDNGDLGQIINDYSGYIKYLGRVENLEVGEDIKKPSQSASAVIKGAEIFIPLAGLIDIDTERKKLEKDLEKAKKQLEKTTKKLGNMEFIKQAPDEIVEKERIKKQDFEVIIDKLNKNLEQLLGW